MKLFGWKSAGRAPARPALLRGRGSWISGAWPRSYEAQLRELYLSNAIAQRAVRLVAEGLASAPLSASDPAALALVEATSGGQSLLETVATQLLLHGNAYVEMLPGTGPKPAELYALRPERVLGMAWIAWAWFRRCSNARHRAAIRCAGDRVRGSPKACARWASAAVAPCLGPGTFSCFARGPHSSISASGRAKA